MLFIELKVTGSDKMCAVLFKPQGGILKDVAIGVRFVRCVRFPAKPEQRLNYGNAT